MIIRHIKKHPVQQQVERGHGRDLCPASTNPEGSRTGCGAAAL